jgi:hypothetical protein
MDNKYINRKTIDIVKMDEVVHDETTLDNIIETRNKTVRCTNLRLSNHIKRLSLDVISLSRFSRILVNSI